MASSSNDDVTKRAQEMYGEHPFGEFSYGRASRERSDHEGKILELPFADNSADATICYGVVMVTSTPEKAFAELVRITKPGGQLFVAVYNKWHPYFWLTYKLTAPLHYVYWNWSKRIADLVYPLFWLYFQLVTRITMGSFMHARSCRTTFMDQVITPTAKLYGKGDLRRFGDSNRCEVIGFGYSRLYAMLSAVYRKRP